MGERNFGLDSLKSINCDMEEKGIVLREVSYRTASELPAPELSDCSRLAPAGHASFGGSSALGVHPPEEPESFGGSSAPGVHRRQSGSSELLGCRRVPPAGAARPLVHKIIAML